MEEEKKKEICTLSSNIYYRVYFGVHSLTFYILHF